MPPQIIPRSGHSISRRDIDPDALKVLYRLHRAGHAAYLVGGGVRDLLLGIRPKDFDISTDAHPQRIRKLFRNCVLIGRRFRLAHVRFGNNVVEVSTFRAAPEEASSPPEDNEDLLIKRDNTFGTPEEDALRRDFTINALFYDIGTYSVIDHVGGLADLEDGYVRSIGDPHVRFQEDPVRMIRAAKFAARLSFEITDDDRDAIAQQGEQLRLASVPRLLEECFKLLRSGHAAACMRLLHELRLLEHWLQPINEHLDAMGTDADPEKVPFYQWLFALDDFIASEDKPVLSNSLMLAALLMPLLEERLGKPAWQAAARDVDDGLEDVMRPLLRQFAVSRRDSERLHGVILLQRRLAADAGTHADKLAQRPDFHEAVAVLSLRARFDEEIREAAEIWSEIAADANPVADARPARRRRGGGGGGGGGAVRGGPRRRLERF